MKTSQILLLAACIIGIVIQAESAVPDQVKFPKSEMHYVLARLKNQATNLRLDSNYQGNVYTLSPNESGFQVWLMVKANNNCMILVNSATGRCLDSNHKGNVYALGCHGGSFQNWRFQNFQLVNCETNRCLDSNFAGYPYTLNCNGGNFQKWINE